ncbi:MAG: hypothetical protein ABSB49_11465 [Polyangia bacterium]|jgi:hypothetical protein
MAFAGSNRPNRKGQANVDSQNDKANAEPQNETPRTGSQPAVTPEEAKASRRRVFIGLGVAAIVIVGAALAVQRSPRSPASIGDIVAADITLVTSDRADVECAAAGSVETYHCGFIDGSNAWKGEDKNKLKPYYTTDRHLYLVPGLFQQSALEQRYRTEQPEGKRRDSLKRFTAKCNLKIAGKLEGVKVRWVPASAWSSPEEVEVATVVDCKVEG